MNREQKLIDLIFEIGLMISDPKIGLTEKPIEEKAAWIAKQLKACGFETTPCGASWGVLKN
jgi:hypothetical protein